jgi:formylglycine-generating enzyme required for sulfatase activity
VENPKGLANGQVKVIRGGSYNDNEYSLRVSERFGKFPNTKDEMTGFRLVVDF